MYNENSWKVYSNKNYKSSLSGRRIWLPRLEVQNAREIRQVMKVMLPLKKKKCSCRFVEIKNGFSFSQIVAPSMSTSVGCRYFSNKLSPHFDAMSLVAQTPWKASYKSMPGPRKGMLVRSNFRIPGSFTCVGVLWRTRYITIVAILIQWRVNEVAGYSEN